jgi:hypothetical protein
VNESPNIDRLETNRRDRRVDDHSLDAETGGDRQARQLEPHSALEILVSERLGNRRQRRYGATNFMDEHGEPLRVVT